MKLVYLFSLLISFSAGATEVICTATCVLNPQGQMQSVQGEGLDIQDALKQLKFSCDEVAKEAKSSVHFLATSIAKPNPQFTASQTEFDIQKACL